MPVVGFNFTKLLAEKTGEINQETRAKSDLKVVDVSQEKLPVGDAEEILKFTFSFTVEYGNAGLSTMEGFLLYMEEPKKIKEIIKEWKEHKRVEADLMTQVLNNILFKTTVKALNLTQDVNLPPHFKLPYVKKQQAEEQTEEN